MIERAASRLDSSAREVFGGHPMLVPVPGSGLTKPHTVWPSRRVCEELVRQGLGQDILPLVSRTTAVPKSAGSATRPSLDQHIDSLTVQARLSPPSRLLLVDDVVTSGTTMMACAIKLAQAFPGVPVSGFALARVQSTGDPSRVFDPLVERVTINGQRCSRGPLE
jgi:predicted amidophosphoribosyltransferase